MNNVLRILQKQKSSLFATSYSPSHNTFITHRIVNEAFHPLYDKYKRILGAREKKRLWWHITVGHNASKMRVVRTWLRRRLINAVKDGLKERGITEDGTFKYAKTATKDGYRHPPIIHNLLEKGVSLALEGSLKLHASPLLVTAKFEKVRKDAGAVIDALIMGLENDLKGRSSVSNNSQPSFRPTHRSSFRKSEWGRPAAAGISPKPVYSRNSRRSSAATGG
jgi:hypothetical protein